ncbi:MAG: NAD-binding protein, partial [Chloroflexota bacterium]
DVIMSARDLNEKLRIVARVWEDDADARVRQFFRVHATYSTSSIATPAFAGAAVGVEIAQIFHIGQQDCSLIRLEVAAGSIFEDRTVAELQSDLDISIVMVKKGDLPEFSPGERVMVRAGDSIMVFAEYQQLVNLIASNVNADQGHIIVMGVGHVGERVTNLLLSMGYRVAVIDREMPGLLRSRLTAYGCQAIQGEGNTVRTLDEANIMRAAAMIVATANDRINFDVSTLARDMNPDLRIVTRVHDARLARQMERYLGVREAISPADVVTPAFVGAATGSYVAKSFQFGGREYSTVRVPVERGGRFIGRTLDALETDLDIDVMIMERRGKTRVAPPLDQIAEIGDELVIFAEHKTLERILEQGYSR